MSAVLTKFKSHCERWRTEQPRLHNYRGRTFVMSHLISRYGLEAVMRHKKRIVRALNNAEGVHVTE